MAKTKTPNLMYPRSVETTGHYLNFYAYDYNKAQSLGVKSMRDMLSGSQMWGNEQLQEEMQNHQIGRFGDPEVKAKRLQNKKNAYNNKVDSLGLQKDKDGQPITWDRGKDAPSNSSIGCVKLYVPPSLEYNYTAEWNQVQFGAIGAAFGGAGNALGAGGATALNATLGKMAEDLGSAAPGSSGFDAGAVIGGAFGMTFNDNTLQTFKKMGTRVFTFNYLLLTRNEEEEREIKDIIKFFKLAMHPGSRRSGTNNSLFLTYPYIFRIIQAGQKTGRGQLGVGKQFLPNTKYCALKDVKVNYTPNENLTLTPNSFVTAVSMNLQFEELTTLTRQDIHDIEDTATEENWGWTEGNVVTDNTGQQIDRRIDKINTQIERKKKAEKIRAMEKERKSDLFGQIFGF
tara:strand:+ start:417 stop:1613 length:1197 start_codon:yes stop_codon:yes gene_type:complete